MLLWPVYQMTWTKAPKREGSPLLQLISNLSINHHLGKELQFTSLTYMSASTSEASEYIRTVSMIFTGCSQPTSECRKTNFYKMQDSSHWWCWLKDSIFPLGQNFLKAVLHWGFSCVSSFLPFLHCRSHISSCSDGLSCLLQLPPFSLISNLSSINLLHFPVLSLLLWGPELIFIPVGRKLRLFPKFMH